MFFKNPNELNFFKNKTYIQKQFNFTKFNKNRQSHILGEKLISGWYIFNKT